jgi:hypothetical protein
MFGSADCVEKRKSMFWSSALNFLAPHGFPRIPLLTSPSHCISSCPPHAQQSGPKTRKCGQLLLARHDARQRGVT